MANTNTYQAQANELSQKLWAIANELRGQMDASEFKNYILGVIFYRYLSERTEMYMAEILENDGVTYEEAFADDDYRSVVEEWSLTKLGYVIRPENLFRNLIRKITKFESEADRFSVEDFEKAINDLVGSTMGHESNKAFDGLFNDMRLKDARLGESVADRTDMIGRVMVKVSDIDFDLQDSQFDVLGTAYMILIGLFASDAGKKGGEFFTPAGPSRLCATLASLGLDEAKTVGDCTCGSASMLLEVQKHLTTHKVGHFYGQELNATTYNLSRMNMIMHGVDWQNFDIYKGDTLKDDKYGYDLRLTVQVCNPPYSLKWSADKKFEDDPRYRGVGKLAPKSAADLAFVEHMMGTILRDKSNRNINYNKTNLDSYKAMKKGDFIIHLRSFEGGLECSNYDGISSPAYKILRTNKLIPEAYKGYFRTYNFIEGKLSAAVVGIRDGKNIDMPTFWEIELNVPSLPEQQKIAEFLSTVDRVIEKQKETITTWKERKKGVMQKLFSQEVRFKANDGSEFPEWEEKKIDDIATCFAGATPSTKIPEYWDNGTIQWMSSGEVNNGQIYETEKRISQLGFDKCSTKMVKPNTVVMALAGQGKTRGMVAITRVPLCTNQSLCAIETNDDICDDYLYQYLQTQYNNLRLISSGDGTRGGLNLKLVGGYVVSMPCFIEQQKIVACLSALDDVIEKKKATLAAWEELKKGLLQQMFV